MKSKTSTRLPHNIDMTNTRQKLLPGVKFKFKISAPFPELLFGKHYDYTCYMQNFDTLAIKLVYVVERTGLSLTFSETPYGQGFSCGCLYDKLNFLMNGRNSDQVIILNIKICR